MPSINSLMTPVQLISVPRTHSLDTKKKEAVYDPVAAFEKKSTEFDNPVLPHLVSRKVPGVFKEGDLVLHRKKGVLGRYLRSGSVSPEDCLVEYFLSPNAERCSVYWYVENILHVSEDTGEVLNPTEDPFLDFHKKWMSDSSYTPDLAVSEFEVTIEYSPNNWEHKKYRFNAFPHSLHDEISLFLQRNKGIKDLRLQLTIPQPLLQEALKNLPRS